MHSVNSTVPQLRELISIEEQRDDLVRQIRGLDSRLISLRTSLNFGRLIIPEKPDFSSTKPYNRAGHGSLKREILALMQQAGTDGISVREVSTFLNIKAANIYAWFHSTGRTIPQISKIGEARYALNGELPPEPEVKPKRMMMPKLDGSMQPRGALTRKIFGALEQAGEQGSTLKELAESVESNYRNVAVWFATTGKRFTNLTKMAPARYRMEVSARPGSQNTEAPSVEAPSVEAPSIEAPSAETPSTPRPAEEVPAHQPEIAEVQA